MLPAIDGDLPVRHVLPAVVAALREAGAAVLVAPPGTGKTTLAPLALAEEFGGRIVVAQPRRVAARAAARRMAALLGQPVGATVGYAVRGERRSGPATRIEVVTTGLLVQRMQHDPGLDGVDALVLDECHERHLDSDLALAFAVEIRGALRPDLRLLAMSATVEADRLAAALGGLLRPTAETGPGGTASPVGTTLPAPVVRAEAALHPVEPIWVPPVRPVAPPVGLRVDPALLDHVAATVRRALTEHPGDILVFLPGVGEISRVGQRLADLRDGVDVLALHGRQSSGEQDAVLLPATRRRVVLATSVAESSLTVPGVRVVVDAGLSRAPRLDLARGLSGLVTVPVSRSSATQRAGRAGREAPGRVYRCWAEATHERLPAHPEPEIATADLTGFVLQLACWGHPDGTGLALPDPPPAAALGVATDTLGDLGAIGADGRVTARGRALAAVGAHPRLARALLDGAVAVGADRAAEVVALLSEDLTGRDDDLVAVWRRLRAGVDAGTTARWRVEVRRLRQALPSGRSGDLRPLSDDLAAGLLVGLAYPERLARVREPGGSTYLMAGGTAADLAPGSPLAGSGWLAVAVADRPPGRGGALVRLAAVVDEETAREAAAPLLRREREIAWNGTDVLARDVHRLGALVLAERAVRDPDPDLVAAALLDGLRDVGLSMLTWTAAAHALRERMAFCRQALGDPWPDVSDEALLARATDWLGPELAAARRRADLGRADVTAGLRRLLPWAQAARLDELAPERLTVPSGSRHRVDYADPAAPVLAVKLQETFGWRDAPRIADGRVPVLLHLLSPAGRPVAVTRDLASFWANGYGQVRAELRGRYPRHPWPEDPTGAEPTRQLRPRKR